MTRVTSLAGWLLYASTLAVATAFAAEEPKGNASQVLAYKTPRGVEFLITADGLSSIRLGERELAKGGWSAWNAEGWFKGMGAAKVKTKTAREKTIEVLGADRARVRHVKEDVVCVFDYSFAGEDCAISARLENTHADEAINVTGFSGLRFFFDRPPEGWMQCQHISYFQAHGIGLCHPGHWSPIGGSYATDNSIGIGMSPWRSGMTRTLILWDYADWNPDKREKLPQRNPLYFVVSSIPPRGAATFDFRIRVSPQRDWKHLLAPYREHFQKTFGEVRYKADCRWIATDYLNHSHQAISPQNPYGFHGGHRRIDTADGAKAFCDTLIAPLKEANGQGVVVWGQGGDDPRGGMYRPDFDILPPEVAANWGLLKQRFEQDKLRLGVCTRPRHMAVRENWKSDAIIDINPDDVGHCEMLWKRFKNMLDKGCTLFYLDSFGSSYEDVKLMRFLREKLGPDVLTYCEHQCDAIIPFSGGYSETTLNVEDPAKAHYGLWSGLDRWEIYRWLVPGAQMASRLYQVKGKPPAELESPERFFFRNHITPLVPMSDAKRMTPLKAVQPEFVDEKGQWKKD